MHHFIIITRLVRIINNFRFRQKMQLSEVTCYSLRSLRTRGQKGNETPVSNCNDHLWLLDSTILYAKLNTTMDEDNVKYTRQDGSASMQSSLLDIHFSRSKRTSIEKFLAAVVLLLFILWIVFLALFIHEKQNKCEVGPSSGSQNGTEPTVEPTSVIPTEPDYGPGPWENIRLPQYFVPSDYDLLLRVNLDEQIFTGQVKINVALKNISDYMYLHVNKLNITSPKLLKNGDDLPLTQNFWYKKNQFYVLEPNDQLAKGDYQIQMNFAGKLDNDLKGLYRSTYKDQDEKEIVIATTQLQPTDARKVFPCFDEPSFKATFKVTIVRHKDMISVTNMPRIDSDTEEDDMVADHYQRTVKMPTYLLAFVVCNFTYVQKYAGSKNTSLKYYATKGQIDQTAVAAEIGGEILERFEKYFNISYPLPKADMIAVPDFAAGAMENWGLIIYRETAMLFKEGQSSERNKERITLVIAHELAHMWFGNLVTLEWWEDLWLNEGFASYLQYTGIDHVEPSWKAKESFVIDDMQSALNLDSLVTSHPILVPVNHPDEINEIFDSISYSKGATILRMLQSFLTEDVFRKGLKNYLNHYRFGNARTKDLWNFLSNASKEALGDDIEVAKIMDTWTLQMGYPVINVTNVGGKMELTQQRFLSDSRANTSHSKYKSSYGYKWWVPITADIRQSDTNEIILTNKTYPITWMDPAQDKTTVNLNKTWNSSKQWVKGNIGHTGFYRINYPVETWKLLAKQLQHDHKVLSIPDRAGLIQDAFALTEARILNMEYALDLSQYLDKEQDYIPWSAGYDSIANLYRILPRSSKAYKGLQKYHYEKVKPSLDRLGFADEGTHLEKYMRSEAIDLACAYKNETCLRNMKTYFDDWIKNETANPVPANLRSLVYFYGMSQSGQKEWDITFKRFESTNVASERRKLLYGLAGTSEPWLIARYLQYTMDEAKIKRQDAGSVVAYIAQSNPIGQHLAWSFFKESWPTILEKYGEGFVFQIKLFIGSITSRFNTDWELEQVNELFEKYPDSGSGTRVRDQTLERIRSNIQWRKDNEKNLEKWLDKNRYLE